jgi:GNAT superfamily N-acetyltransferase
MTPNVSASGYGSVNAALTAFSGQSRAAKAYGLVMESPAVTIRHANAKDASTVHRFICDLALYEKEPDAVKCTSADLEQQLASERPPFEALLAEQDGVAVGFALFFANYSTWRGTAGIHLEDLFVPEEHRGSGIGTALLAELSRLTLERGGARLEWQVLDWNEPSIRYYESIDAAIMREWLPCRLDGDALLAMAAR